ncbi:MAG TPA: cupin domain-containing protein [Acidimicrobiia bacterium]|nr:cupin domain-containing protein [Acidimicrobiia bacterium]
MDLADREGREALTRAVGDPDHFAEKLWATHPQHRQGSAEQGFTDLLSLDDVDLVVSTTGLRLPLFRMVKDGEVLPAGRYTKTTRTGSHETRDVIDSRAVFGEFATGATIVFQSMHRYWQPLADYCRGLELALGHPVQANAYITPPGAQGFGAHEDEHDVFVLQSHGTKQWWVHERNDLPPTRPAVIDALLAPGDSLYIPSGFPHSAATQDRESVHITIGILAIPWTAVIKEAMKIIESDPGLQVPLPLRYAMADGEFDDEVGRRLGQVATLVTGLNPAPIARRLRRKVLTTRQSLLRGQMHRLLSLEQIGDESRMVRRARSICVLEHVGGRLSVMLGDRELLMPLRVEPAMQLISAGESFRVSDLPGLDQAGRLVLMRRLVREGLLEVVV